MDVQTEKYLPGLRVFFAILLGFFPVAVFVSKAGTDVIFYLIILVSSLIIFISRKSEEYTFFQFFKKFWPLFLSMAAFFIAELINQIFVNGINFNLYNYPIIFLSVPFIAYALIFLSRNQLKLIQWGFVASSFVSFGILFFVSEMGRNRPETYPYVGIHVIPFTSLSVMVGFLSLLSIGFDSVENNWKRALKIMAFVLTLASAYISQTRGVWLSVFLMGIAIFVVRWGFGKRTFMAIVLSVCFCVFSFFISGKVQNRIEVAKEEIVLYEKDSNRPTSIGYRLELFKASWRIFKNHPWFGIGPKNYVGELRKMIEKKELISGADVQGGHAHNELLHRSALYGIWGFVVVFSYTLVPLFYFLRMRNSPEIFGKTVMVMGVVFSLGFLFFGLTDIIFYRRQVNCFYSVTLAFLLALLINTDKRKYLSSPSKNPHS